MSSRFSPRTLIHFGRGFTGMVLLCTPFATWISGAGSGDISLVAFIYDCWLMTFNHFSAAALIHNSVLSICLLTLLIGSLTLILPTATRAMRLILLGIGLLFVGSVFFFGAAVSNWGIGLCGVALLIGFALEVAESLLDKPHQPQNPLPVELMHYVI